MLPSSTLSHCPIAQIYRSPLQRKTPRRHNSLVTIFKINPSRRHFQHKRKFCVTVWCGSSEITPLVRPSRMKLPFDRSIEIKFYFHCQCYFSHHCHPPIINTLLWGTFKCWTENIFCSKQPFYMDSTGIWGSSLWWPPLCVLQLEGWGKLSLDIRGVAWWGEELSD